MPMNSNNIVEVLRPCSKSTTTIEQLTTEQLNRALELVRDVEAAQEAIKALTSSYAGKLFAALEGDSLRLSGQAVAVEGLDALFNSDRVLEAAKAFELEATRQWQVLRAFANLLDRVEG